MNNDSIKIAFFFVILPLIKMRLKGWESGIIMLTCNECLIGFFIYHRLMTAVCRRPPQEKLRPWHFSGAIFFSQDFSTIFRNFSSFSRIFAGIFSTIFHKKKLKDSRRAPPRSSPSPASGRLHPQAAYSNIFYTNQCRSAVKIKNKKKP